MGATPPVGGMRSRPLILTALKSTADGCRILSVTFKNGSGAMKANVGGLDRAVRLLAGIGLLVWAVTGGPAWAWIGVVPLATGLVGFCPLYRMLGISTRRRGSAASP